MRSIVIILLLYCFSANAQEEVEKKNINLKLNMVNAGMVFQPNFTMGAEFLMGPNQELGLEPGIGFVFYSTEENVRASGIKLYQTVNSYFKKPSWGSIGVTATGFYQSIKLVSPLLVDKELDGFKYREYEDMLYSKTRYGGSMGFVFQPTLGNDWVIDIIAGLKLTQFNTKVPNGVVQKDFPNGFYYEKSILVPGLNFGLKIGYRI